MHRSLRLIPSTTIKLGKVVDAYNSSSWEVEAGECEAIVILYHIAKEIWFKVN